MPDTIKGDIKTLYAYYRLSDYESTNLSLVDKTLDSEVYFEGHMNWSFKYCSFQAYFAYGLPGERLEGDLRGNPDEEPFPPYGSNGVVFDGCEFNKEFEIWDNCVVLFKDCTFNNSSPIKIGDNCRVEFIDCGFHGPLDFSYFCEIRMRGCEFSGLDYAINAVAHCKFFIDDTTAEGVDQYFLSVEDDCTVDVASKDSTNFMTNSAPVFKGKDRCVIRLYGLGVIQSEVGPTLEVSEDSKIEAREITLINCPSGDTVSILDNSEGYFKEIPEILSTSKNCFTLDKSVLRFRNVGTILSTAGNAINATDSKVYGMEMVECLSESSDTVVGIRSSFDLANGEKISSAGGNAIQLVGESKSSFRDFIEIQGQTTGVSASASARVVLQRVQDAIKGLEGSGCDVDGGVLRVADCALIDGKTVGIKSSNSARVQTRNVDKILGNDEEGLYLEDSVYDIHTAIDGIYGKSTGAHLGNCRGVISDVELIRGEDAIGLYVLGASGPSEFARINKIEADAETAAYLSIGENVQLQVVEVGEILSQSGDAVAVYAGNNSTIDFYGVEKITSIEGKAIVGDITGRLVVAESDAITSQNDQTIVLLGNGINSFIRFNNINSVTADVSEESPFFVSGANTTELDGIQEISVSETKASVVELQGRGVDYGSIKVLDCPSITAEECSNGLFVHNALISDVVGTDAECEIVTNTTKFAAFSAKDTNLYLSNYRKIEAKEEGHAIDLEVINARGVEMKIYTVREILGAKDGIHYLGNGNLKLVTLPKIEAGSDTEDHALYIEGNLFVTTQLHDVNTTVGMVQFISAHAALYNCTLNASVYQYSSRVEFFHGSVAMTGNRAFDADAASATYFFDTTVTDGKATFAGVVEADVSSFLQGDILGAGTFNACKFTDYWHIDDGAAAIFNAHETSGQLHVQGGVTTAALLNGYKSTGALGLEIADGAGVILGGGDFASGNIAVNNNCAFFANNLDALASTLNMVTDAAAFLNRAELDDFEMFTNSGVIANAVKITQALSVAGSNALLFNRVACAGITATFSANAMLFNWVEGGPVTLNGGAIVASQLLSDLDLGAGGSGLLSGGYTTTIPSGANLVAAGVTGIGGSGNSVTVTEASVTPPSAGVAVRGLGANAQVFIKTVNTYEVFGNVGTDILRSALNGEIKDQAADITHVATADITQEAANITREASVDISDNATGDIIRNATGDIVDIAVDLDRLGSGTITDTATAIVHVPPV